MIELRITQNKSRLENVFQTADSIQEEELKSHLARYLCILTSGFIEESIKLILEQYVKNNSSPNIVNYFTWATQNLTNLNVEKIERILNNFNQKFGKEFVESLSDEEKDAINSIVANRNNIAHGRNVGVSYIRIKKWYEKASGILDNIRIIFCV